MRKTLIEELSANHLNPMTLMLEYRAGRLDDRLSESLFNILVGNLEAQDQLITEEPYKSLILSNHDSRISKRDIQLWKQGSLNSPKRRIAVDQYIKASLARLSQNQELKKIHDLTKIESLNQFIFLHRFEAYAKYYPNHPALVFKDQMLTYAQLNARANQLARYLLVQKKSLHIQANQEFIIGTFLPREPEWIIAILAIWKADGAFIAIDPTAIGNSPDAVDNYFEKFAQTIADAKPAFILTHSDHQYLLPKPENNGFSCICLDDCTGEIESQPTENTDIKIDPNNLAYILYTSGSSGKPKGVEIAHRGFMPCLEAHRECVDLTHESIMAQYATCDFDAWVAEMLILGVGGTLVIVPSEIRLDAKECSKYYQDHDITIAIFTPAFLDKLGGPQNFSKWKALFIVGDSFSWDLVKKWKPQGSTLQIVNGYGPTENTICTTLENLDMDESEQPLSIGKAIIGSKLLVKVPTNFEIEEYGDKTRYKEIDSSDITYNEKGEITGEIWISGISLMRGYRGTAKNENEWRFQEIDGESYYKTSDQAILFEKDKRMIHLGRFSRMVKINGQRIELPSIERHICEQFGIEFNKDVRVEAVGENEESKELTTLVIFLLQEAQAIIKMDDSDIKHLIAEKLMRSGDKAEKNVKIAIMWLAKFENNHAKINHKALINTYFLRTKEIKFDHNHSTLDTTDEVEKEIYKKLLIIWREILPKTNPKPEDDFFELGGRSIDISLLVQSIRRVFPNLKDEITNIFVLECRTLLSQTKRIYSLERPVELIPLPRNKKENSSAPYIVFCPPSILGNPEQDYTELFSQYDKIATKPIFDERFQVYGLKARGLSDPSLMPTTLYSMAQDYALTIKNWIVKNNRSGIPIFILGWSSGGTITPEIVNSLAKYNIQAFAYVCDSIAPFPFHHFTDEEHTAELALLAQLLCEKIGLKLDTNEITSTLTEVQKPRDRIICCFDYLIKRAKVNDVNILKTAKLIRLAEHNYMIRDNLPVIRLYKAKDYLLNGILKEDRINYWPKKNVANPNEPFIEGDHFQLVMSEKSTQILSKRIASAIESDYSSHKIFNLESSINSMPNYIIPYIKNLTSPHKEEQLSAGLVRFFKDRTKKVLLIQGESGIGKTYAIDKISEAFKTLNVKHKIIRLNREKNDKINEAISRIKQDWNELTNEICVLIFEAYDEKREGDINYYEFHELSDCKNLKVIFTTRSESLEANYRTNFQPNEVCSYEEWVIQRMNDQQMHDLIKIELSKKDNQDINIKHYHEHIIRRPELKEMARTPLILALITQIPNLEYTNEITRFMIFQQFTENYFRRGITKIKASIPIPKTTPTFEEKLKEKTRKIALNFFKKRVTTIEYHYDINSKSKWDKLLNSYDNEGLIDYNKEAQLKCCPITISGNIYQFLHPSVLEYFIVDAIISILLKKEGADFISNEKVNDHFVKYELYPSKLITNQSVARFWQEAFISYPQLTDRLIHFIKSSCQNEQSALGAIAITLLNLAGYKFKNLDFSGVNISGATLDRSIFINVQFNHAKLNNVSFEKATLIECCFSRAQLSNINFKEHPDDNIFNDLTDFSILTDGTILAASIIFEDINSIKLWNMNTYQEIAILRGHTGPIISAKFSFDSQYLISESKDETRRTWDCKTFECIEVLNIKIRSTTLALTNSDFCDAHGLSAENARLAQLKGAKIDKEQETSIINCKNLRNVARRTNSPLHQTPLKKTAGTDTEPKVKFLLE